LLYAYVISQISMHINRGIELEDRLHTELRRVYGESLLTEKDLTRQHGWHASSVDFLIETDEHLIFIQVKYLNTRRKESVQINKFLKSIEHIRGQLDGHTKTKECKGMWVARLHPFQDNENLLRSCNIQVISCLDSMEALISKTMQIMG
jgi:hypothetical protein